MRLRRLFLRRSPPRFCRLRHCAGICSGSLSRARRLRSCRGLPVFWPRRWLRGSNRLSRPGLWSWFGRRRDWSARLTIRTLGGAIGRREWPTRLAIRTLRGPIRRHEWSTRLAIRTLGRAIGRREWSTRLAIWIYGRAARLRSRSWSVLVIWRRTARRCSRCSCSSNVLKLRRISRAVQHSRAQIRIRSRTRTAKRLCLRRRPHFRNQRPARRSHGRPGSCHRCRADDTCARRRQFRTRHYSRMFNFR